MARTNRGIEERNEDFQPLSSDMGDEDNLENKEVKGMIWTNSYTSDVHLELNQVSFLKNSTVRKLRGLDEFKRLGPVEYRYNKWTVSTGKWKEIAEYF